MPRNMSFAMTTQQVRNRSKDVTRRFGWHFLKAGDIVCAVVKSMGLKKGEKVERLGMIEIVSTRLESLFEITQEDVVREGFPDWGPADFIDMLMTHYSAKPWHKVNRIEFKYLEDD